MYLFVEEGLRGGISYICKRFSEANNKDMKNSDPTKLSKYILYLNENNLDGWAISGYLLYGGFKWLKDVDNFNVSSINENSSTDYILEVHLEYPEELCELHNDYPLAPEKFAIPYEMLSNYCKKIVDEYGIKIGDVKKLILNLSDKTNYVVHYKNLQLYLSLGMKLTKIHKVLRFRQSDCMKEYIDFNTEKRKNAANSFEKYFLKLMVNSVFGKKS